MINQKTRKALLLCLLMIAATAVLTSADTYFFSLHSYHGSELIPNDKHSTYLQNTRFTLGHYRQFTKGLSIAVQGLYVHDFFNEDIRLDSLEINQQLGDWSAGYKVYDKEFGNHSCIHRQDASSTAISHGILETYRLNGLEVQHRAGDVLICGGAGGNELNRTLGFGEFNYKGYQHSVTLGGLYAARGNLNNQNEFALYAESHLQFPSLSIYGATMGEYYRATSGEKKTTRLQTYIEPQWKATSWLLVSAGYHYVALDCARAWNNGSSHKISALSQISRDKWQATAIQHISHAKAQDFIQHQIIVSYLLRPFWNIGFNIARYAPDPGKETWQVGFQTMLNYGTN